MSYFEIMSVTFLLIISISIFGWSYSLVIKDASIADILWGLYFVCGALFIYFVFDLKPTFIQSLVLILVVVWGTRLSLHIGLRKVGKDEDYRYKNWRLKWGPNFRIYSLVSNFLFQALLAVIVLSSTMVIFYSNANRSISWWQVIGIIIWFIGFGIEAISDFQLNRFKKNPQNKGHILSEGLWRYSRHPNYFGEITQWWGIWVISISFNYYLIGLLSPLLITFLIVKVSGVSLLEKHYHKNSAYQKYAKNTPSLIPFKITRKVIK